MKTLRELVVGLLVVLTSPIWIVAILILKIFERPADLKPTEVESWLQRMAAGEMDEYWWEDFLLVPIKDTRLDAIRKECEVIWDPQSKYLTRTGEHCYQLNCEGKKRIHELLSECREIDGWRAQRHA